MIGALPRHVLDLARGPAPGGRGALVWPWRASPDTLSSRPEGRLRKTRPSKQDMRYKDECPTA